VLFPLLFLCVQKMMMLKTQRPNSVLLNNHMFSFARMHGKSRDMSWSRDGLSSVLVLVLMSVW